MKIIITGVTGMVGEGVLLACIKNAVVEEILIIGRKHYAISNLKVKQLVLKKISEIGNYSNQLKNYNGCFFCAGVSSIGENEESFTKKTYNFVVPFATTLSQTSPNIVFIYVSGYGTDSTEKGKVMWARVKGRTENALMQLPFKGQYNFRPAVIKATNGQKNVKVIYKLLGPIVGLFFSSKTITLKQIGEAMINAVLHGYPTPILEVTDIIKLAN